MREAVFVRRHADDWKTFEDQLANGRGADPDALGAGYVRLGDDLAYAQTFYPGSATTAYLNDLSAEVHGQIYRNRREERGRILRFWAEEVPRAVAEAKWPLLISLGLFLGSVAIGLASAAGDASFVRAILGDGYVNMTLANIEDGDPLAVYKGSRELNMTFGIAFNNVLVSFMAFIGMLPLGRFAVPGFSFGTSYILISNGVMVGAFAHLFIAEGLFVEWFRGVFIHGALELSVIVVAGGAGLAMGNALLFPGTYPRLVSLRRGASRGLKIIIGAVPIWITAAILESFVTRHNLTMPLAASVLIIGGSFAFMAFYYVWLPWRVAQRDRRQLAASNPATA